MTLDHITSMAEHKGACEALLNAARLLRASGHRDAAELLIERVPNLVPECVIPPDDPAPNVLPGLPDTWPFPNNAGEGEL